MQEIIDKIEGFCQENFLEYWWIVLIALAALFILLIVFIIITAVKSGKVSKLKAQLNSAEPSGGTESTSSGSHSNEYQEMYESEYEKNRLLNKELERLTNELLDYKDKDFDDAESDDFARKYTNAKSEIERLNGEVERLNGETNRLNNEIGRLQEENEKGGNAVAGSDGDLKRQYQALKITYTEEKQEVDRLTEENENLLRNLSAKERELAAKERELERNMSSKERELAAKERELERTKDTLEKANLKATTATTKLAAAKTAAGASSTAATVDAPAAKTARPAKPEESDNSNDAQYYVSFDKAQGDWVVKREGATRATRRMATKEEAVRFAKEISRKNDVSLAIKKKDGKFQRTKY